MVTSDKFREVIETVLNLIGTTQNKEPVHVIVGRAALSLAFLAAWITLLTWLCISWYALIIRSPLW